MRTVEPTGRKTVGARRMIMPDDAVGLRVLEDRCRELRARKEDAERRHARARANQLQAEIDELEADYGSIIRAAALI